MSRSSRSRSLGEQWNPCPSRLLRAILEAPTAQRRAWAQEYLALWLLAFHRAQRGEQTSLREMLAHVNGTNKARARAAREDALACLRRWENGTLSGQHSDSNRTEDHRLALDSQVALGQHSDSDGTLARALPYTDTELQSSSSLEALHSSPADNPADSEDKGFSEICEAAASAPRRMPRPIARYLWSQGYKSLEQIASFPSRGHLCAYLPARLVNRAALDLVEQALREEGLQWKGIEEEAPLSAAPAPSAPAYPATPAEAWERILAALETPQAMSFPCEQTGWILWPRARHPAVHEALLEALCLALEEKSAPAAWQRLLQMRLSDGGQVGFNLNTLGRSFRRAWPSVWSARATA